MKISKIIDELTELQKYIGDVEVEGVMANSAVTSVNVMYLNDKGDWNYSAPHGAGRLMTRADAKNSISMAEYKDAMKGIFTSCVSSATIDESPMAYKPMQEIITNIEPTCTIEKIIKPVYNFKAAF